MTIHTPDEIKAEIIKQEQATEESFMDKARALKRQAREYISQAQELELQAEEFIECANIAHNKIIELESDK